MPLNHVISSSGLTDLILIHPVRWPRVAYVEEKKQNIEFSIALNVSRVLYETFKGVLITQGQKVELSQLPHMDAGMQRTDIFLRHSGVSICVTGCQKRELKAQLCIVLQSSRSIRAKMKWENHKIFMH